MEILLVIPLMIFIYLIIMLIFVGPFYLIFSILKFIINLFKRQKNFKYFQNNTINKSNNYKQVYKDISRKELEKFNTDDINILKDYFYNLFIEFENAYNSLDYNKMKILTTNEMYNNYYTGISLNLKFGRKRIISDVEKKKVILFALDSTIHKQVATLMIEIKYINYTTDSTGKLISGNRNKIKEKFEVTFRKDFATKNIVDCPTCGAQIIGNRCEFCRQTLMNPEFKISSIKKIIE